MKLFVVRHGETMNNKENRISGIVDVPLDGTGRRQAEELAARLALQQPENRIRHIISSNLVRAKETADVIAAALGLPVVVDPRFHEVSFGTDEGTLFPDRPYQSRKDEPFARFPGGESLVDAAVRIYPALDDIRATYRDNVLLVCHGMMGRVVATYFRSFTIAEFKGNIMPNCSLVGYNMDAAERHAVPDREPWKGGC